jgi:hypothetical protein
MAIWNMLARLKLDATAFERNTKKAKASLYELQKQSLAANQALARMAQQGMVLLGLGGGLYAVSRAFGTLSKSMADIDKIGKMSDALGIATEDLAALRHAAALSGVEVEQLGKGLQIFTRYTSEAAAGIGTSDRIFRELGLSARELAGMDLQARMEAFADAFQRTGNEADQTRYAMTFFGKSGAAMTTMLRQGGAALAEASAEAEKLGLTFTRLDARKVEAAGDSLTRMKGALEGLRREVVVQLAPYLELMSDRLTAMAAEGRGFGDVMVAALKNATLGAVRFLDTLRDIHDLVTAIPRAAAELGAGLGLKAAISNLADKLYEQQARQQGIEPWRDFVDEPTATGMRVPMPRQARDKTLYAQMRQQAESILMSQGDDWTRLPDTSKLSSAKMFFAELESEIAKINERTRERLEIEQKIAAIEVMHRDLFGATAQETSEVEKLITQQRIQVELLEETDEAARAVLQSRLQLAAAYRTDIEAGRDLSPEDFERQYEVLGQLVRRQRELAEEQKKGTGDAAEAMARMYAQIDSRSKASFAAQAALIEQQRKAYVDLGIDMAAVNEWHLAMQQRLGEDRAKKTGGLTSGMRAGISEMVRELKTVGELGADMALSFRDNLVGGLDDALWRAGALGDKLRDVLVTLGRMATQWLLMQSVTGFMSFAFPSLAPSARGNVFGPGGAQPFARGGVVTRPTLFPFAGGVGLMGEAGAEAIMPLRRHSSGRLGVEAVTPKIEVIVNNENARDIEVTVGDSRMDAERAVMSLFVRSKARRSRMARAAR